MSKMKAMMGDVQELANMGYGAAEIAHMLHLPVEMVYETLDFFGMNEEDDVDSHYAMGE